jgi:hypothetical protein
MAAATQQQRFNNEPDDEMSGQPMFLQQKKT